jgi:EAL domain-containing protein (putative c-di-GMP-specific phosphodiesterase class I)
VELASGRVAGFESLLRWRDPELGVVGPAEFVALAEETGQILELGKWVLREATQQAARWQREGVTSVPVAVNVSSSQIDSGLLIETLHEILEESGLSPEKLDLEVTESALLRDEDLAIDLLYEVRRLGIGLSLDDFGTGYSSLSYLRRLPIDTVKIDRSFVEGIADNGFDHALLESIVSMASVLGLTVVAEGVETESQRDLLSEMGCDVIQGFWYSAPVPAEQVPLAIAQCEADAKRGQQ